MPWSSGARGTTRSDIPAAILDQSIFVADAGFVTLPNKPERDAAMPPAAGSIQAAIKQTRPFRSRRQEAFIGLLLTAEATRWPFLDLLAGHEQLTLQQYNVLRILRGAGDDGLPTLEIANRMIERTPGVTRLIDRMEQKDLVSRQRAKSDRRQVICRITANGLSLLRKLDRPIDTLEDSVFAALDEGEVTTLITLLDKVRVHNTRNR